MNIGIKRIWNNKGFSFRKMLIGILAIISVCIQVIYLGYSGYKFNLFSNKILDAGTELAHQTMMSNVNDIMEQIESLFTFVQIGGIASYADMNLNLRSEENAEELLAEMRKQCEDAEIQSDIVKGFLVVGRNENQKSLYYDFSKRKLEEYQALEQNMLEDSDLSTYLYQNFGIPMQFSDKDMEQILAGYGGSVAQRSTLEQVVSLCSKHYVVVDIISNVTIVAFLDKECFSLGLSEQQNFGFALYSADMTPVFQYGNVIEGFSDNFENNKYYDYHIQKNRIWPEGLWAVTVCKNDEHYLSGKQALIPILSIVLVDILAFTLAYLLLTRLMNVFKLLEKLLVHSQNKYDEPGKKKRKSTRFGEQLFVTLLITCIIPFLLINVICNRRIENCGERLMKKHLDNGVVCYESALRRLEGDCKRLSTGFAVDLISDYSINNPKNNQEIVKEFEKLLILKSSSLLDYSYVVVADKSHSIIYQSAYYGRPELFENVVYQSSVYTKASPDEPCFLMSRDQISEEEMLVFYAPVKQGNEFVGSMLFFLSPQVLDDYMGVASEEFSCLWPGEDGWAEQSEDRTVLVKECQQDILPDSEVRIRLNVEQYVSILDSVAEDSTMIGVILILVLILVSLFMTRLMLTPIVGMSRNFSQSKAVPEKMQINTSVKEINDLIAVYNSMVERQEQLQKENEERHENEKHLIELRAQSEFKMLQQQINPHFMFNTLEVINLLAVVNHVDDISSIAKALASILRFSLNRSQTVTVQKEVTALNDYLLIQRMRFGDRIDFEVHVEEKILDDSILKFILQPLVENAVSHGMKDKFKGGKITVDLSVQESVLLFSVSDNGIGIQESELQKLRASIYSDMEEYGYTTGGSGIGLKNIYRRLKFYYGDEADMIIESKYQKGTVIKLVLPEKHLEKEDEM